MAETIDDVLLQDVKSDRSELVDLICSEGVDSFDKYKYLVGRYTELTRLIYRIEDLRKRVDED
jgi:hypothetical protein